MNARTDVAVAAAVDLVEIAITAVVEQEYQRRGVFPDLRKERAITVIPPATSLHRVPEQRVREIIEDAEVMLGERRKELCRGLPVAFDRLRDKALELLKVNEALQRAQQFVGKLDVADPANYEAIAEAFGLEFYRGRWGDSFTGTKQQLVAAGVAVDGSFPGDPGRGPTSVTYRAKNEVEAPLCLGAVKLGIRRFGTRFQVQRSPDPEEAARRHYVATLGREVLPRYIDRSLDFYGGMRKEMAATIAGWPKTAKAHRRVLADKFWTHYQAFTKELEFAGFRLTDDALDNVKSLASDLFWFLKNDVETYHTEAAQQADELKVRADVAKWDPYFRTYMEEARKAAVDRLNLGWKDC